MGVEGLKDALAYKPLTRFWFGLSEPRFITVTMLFVYSMIIFYGLYQLLFPWAGPEHLDEAIRILVGLTFFGGGVVGLLATPKGYWQFERAAIGLVLTGFGAHILWTFYDPEPGIHWGQLFRLVLGCCFFTSRLYRISWARMDPEK